MQPKLDFLAIGDIVTDAFIELEDAWIEDDNPLHTKELCMRFGDKIPYKDVVVIPAVGNSPNAAVSAHRLGLSSAILTDLGDDRFGEDCIKQLKDEGVSFRYVRVHDGKKSNYHYVLRWQAERTILVKHHEYNYALPSDLETNIPEWFYLSSLGENSLPYHEEIGNFLEKHKEVKFVFQPGTFQIKLGVEKLKNLYKNTHIFFCNKEEAQKILDSKETDVKKLMEGIRGLGPKIAVVTDGPNGAYAHDGNEAWFCPMYPDPKPPVDRTGAGDSFSSTFSVALALGKTIPEALEWGPINSMSVVQYIGAQKGLLTKEKLEQYLEEAPESYKASKI